MRGDLGEDQMMGVCREVIPVLETVVGDDKVRDKPGGLVLEEVRFTP